MHMFHLSHESRYTNKTPHSNVYHFLITSQSHVFVGSIYKLLTLNHSSHEYNNALIRILRHVFTEKKHILIYTQHDGTFSVRRAQRTFSQICFLCRGIADGSLPKWDALLIAMIPFHAERTKRACFPSISIIKTISTLRRRNSDNYALPRIEWNLGASAEDEESGWRKSLIIIITWAPPKQRTHPLDVATIRLESRRPLRRHTHNPLDSGFLVSWATLSLNVFSVALFSVHHRHINKRSSV